MLGGAGELKWAIVDDDDDAAGTPGTGLWAKVGVAAGELSNPNPRRRGDSAR